MAKKINPLIWIGIIWLCCVFSAGYLSLARPGIGTHWEQEPAPPKPITRLELGKAGEVIGHTSEGTMYEFTYGIYQSQSAWQKVEQPSGTPAIGESCTPDIADRIVLPPPGKVVSRVSENCSYIESGYRFEVVLLENGQIWSWEHETYAYAVLLIMLILFIALAIGILILLIGIVIVIYKKIKKTA